MSTEFTDAALAQIREIINCLQSPIADSTALLRLLSTPLARIGLLPPRFRQYDDPSSCSGDFDAPRHIPLLQRAILQHVIPAWEPVLMQEDAYTLVEQYFCPDSISFTSPASGQVAVHAYSTILALPLTESAIRLLAKLSKAYPIDVLHSAVFLERSKGLSGKQDITWEDCVRNIAAVPAKVANALRGKDDIPPELEYGTYFNGVSVRCEYLISTLSASRSREKVSSVAYLLAKLVNIGVFSSSRPTSVSQPSFFQATLSTIRARIAASDTFAYTTYWRKILTSLPSSLVLQSVLVSLFSSLTDIPLGLDGTALSRSLVKREAQLLRHLVGRLSKEEGDLLDAFSAVALGREWSEGHARIFACWAAGAETHKTDEEALEILRSKVIDMWTTPEHIKHSLLSRHHFITSLLLLTLSCSRIIAADAPSPAHTLAMSPPFIFAVSTYISHLDPAVQRCGMLVAEEVARASGKRLDFGDWEGEEQGKHWCQRLRKLIQARDADADEKLAENVVDKKSEGSESNAGIPIEPLSQPSKLEPSKLTVHDASYDSDDSLNGYASSPPSSRSPSPTPSELAEIEKDPTLRVGQKKIARPVYLAQLGEMVRSTSGLKTEQEEDQARKIQVALDVAGELIRRKREYGTELEENAVNLTYGFVGLQDNYDTEGFDEKRQAALNALVVCCPRKAAPTIIEEFFRNQYSTDQRYIMLNALALGARELASLPLPPSFTVRPDRISFPSKRLPPTLHQKYLTAGDQSNISNPVQLMLDSISRQAIEKGGDATKDKVPEFVRERQLRIRKRAKVTELQVSGGSVLSRMSSQQTSSSPSTFTEVAAEFFICPLVNRFWLFLRDEQVREARTAHQPALHRYRGVGTGLVLNAVVLARFLSTLAVLVHAARNAPEWLAIIAPDALELAVTLGTRPISTAEEQDHDVEAELADARTQPGSENDMTGKGKEAAVLTAALELALIVLDGALDLDGGRSLGLEHTALLLGAGEWAGKMFAQLEKGIKVLGGGGTQEVRLRSAAAGVVLKVDELTSKWRRSMIDVGSV
ncbi:hypothetical protein AcV7_009125 [Taiwanofungus camphoratus]|nr:hypothetical protein AcV7_009125 [Antrodia cinnamomea]